MNLVCPACGTTSRVPDARLQDQAGCGRCGAALRSIPSLVLFRGGRAVARLSGALPAGERPSRLQAQLGNGA